MTTRPIEEPPIPLGGVNPKPAYNQGTDPRWGSINKGGVCQALAIYWIVLGGAKENFWNWLYMKQLDVEKRVKKVMEEQKILRAAQDDLRAGKVRSQYTQPVSPSNTTDFAFVNMARACQVIKDDGLAMSKGRTEFSNKEKVVLLEPGPVTIAASILNNQGYVLFSFYGTRQPDQSFFWHTCAAYVSGLGENKQVTFFEPNYGEYLFVGYDTFHTAFDDLLRNMYKLKCNFADIMSFTSLMK